MERIKIFHPSFFVDVNDPHSFIGALEGEDSLQWERAMDLNFNLYKTKKFGCLLLFH
jgi:hypothetical protein